MGVPASETTRSSVRPSGRKCSTTLGSPPKAVVASVIAMLLRILAAALVVGLISGGFIWLVVRRPVRRLTRGMQMVSSGDLTQHLLSTSQDELGQLAQTFNSMTQELARARSQVNAWSETLEQKVREKTADLERAHRQMVGVEKMASLGNLASSVAHELNNPLEGILTFARLLVKRVQRSTLPAEEAGAAGAAE